MSLGQKYRPPPPAQCPPTLSLSPLLQVSVWSLLGWLGYFSARSRLNEGVLSATAIMMWPCGWGGQKQATNFGQTPGQKQTRHTQSERMLGYEICVTTVAIYSSSPPLKHLNCEKREKLLDLSSY